MGCITRLLESGAEKLGKGERAPFVEGGGVYKGYEYLITLNTIGFRCGYVAVSKGHPLYDKEHYDDLAIDVHGGLTFFDKQMTPYKCSDKWLGFDCGHLGNAWDFEALKKKGYKGAEPLEKIINDSEEYMQEKFPHFYVNEDTIKDASYVERECKNIIDQLVAQ